MDIKITITAPDGVKTEHDISDKKYLNLIDLRQKAEIAYLRRLQQNQVKK